MGRIYKTNGEIEGKPPKSAPQVYSRGLLLLDSNNKKRYLNLEIEIKYVFTYLNFKKILFYFLRKIVQ